MAAKRGFRVRSSTVNARSSDAGSRRGRVAIAVAAATVTCLSAASPALATTGGVYFDGNDNAAAGNTANLFNATFTGQRNVGLAAPTVMPALTSGNDNIAFGTDALHADTSGQANVALGSGALSNNTTANNNVAIGGSTLFNTTGDRNIALGSGAGENLTGGSENIDIGNTGRAEESAAIRIGTKGVQTRTWIAGVSGRTVKGTAQPVVVNAQGQLGTASAAAAKTKGAASADRKLRAKVNRLERAVRELRAEVRRGR